MKSRIMALFIVFVAVNLSANDEASSPNYYQDIRPIIESKCMACHSESGVSFSFEDPEKAYGFHSAMNSAVQQRRMPPWLAEDGHQDYDNDASLSGKQIALFKKWADSGYPKGSPSMVGHAQGAKVEDFKPDLTLDLSRLPYLPKQQQKDDYHCFVIDWPVQQDKYITGFRARPGNLKIAHHIGIFLVQPEFASIIRELDSEEKGEGYSCLTGIVPDRLGDKGARSKFENKYPEGVKNIHKNSDWLAFWAPGTYGYSFPKNTGIAIKKGSLLVAQVHYYSAFAPGEKDNGSQISFILADAVDDPATYIPLTNEAWLNGRKGDAMAIPVGQQRRFEVRVPIGFMAGFTARRAGLEMSQVNTLTIHSSNIHMHSYGASGISELTYKNGQKETLLSIPRWDIGWQRNFSFLEGKTFGREQFRKTQYSVECTFKNYSGKTVYGGFGSDDEMCYDFVYVSIETDNKP